MSSLKELSLGKKVIILSGISSFVTFVVLTFTAVSVSDNSIFGVLLLTGLVAIGLSVGLAFFFAKNISNGRT